MEIKQLILGGEVHNSSASSKSYMEKKIWKKISELNINTLLIPVYWENIEPEENKFDFSLVEHHLLHAEKNNINIVFLWFGLWKNGLSTYTPEWVKTSSIYFRLQNIKGVSLESISPLCEAAILANEKAFSKFCVYLEMNPLKHRVVMLQIENELGALETDRDYSPVGEKKFKDRLPTEIKDIYPEKKSWNEFENGAELFMAYHYAKALEELGKIAKKHLDILLYTNVWLKKKNKKPGEYPSGGAVASTWRIWKAVASSLDFFAPDVYEESIHEIFKEYQKDQLLFIPETRIDKKYISNIFFAFGRGAIGYSPFGIEDLLDNDVKNYDFLKKLGLNREAFNAEGTKPYLNKAYQIIKMLEFLLLNSAAHNFSFKKENDISEIEYTPQHDTLWKIKLLSQGDMINSAGIVIKHKETYYITGANFALELNPEENRSSKTGILSLEQGSFIDGRWVTERRLNGDEAYFPYIGEDFKILKLRVYYY